MSGFEQALHLVAGIERESAIARGAFALEATTTRTLSGARRGKGARAAAEADVEPYTIEKNGINFDIKVGSQLLKQVPVPYKVLAEDGTSPWAPGVKWGLPTQRPDGSWMKGAMHEGGIVDLNVRDADLPKRPGLYVTDSPFPWMAEAEYLVRKHPDFLKPGTKEQMPLKIFGVEIEDEGPAFKWITSPEYRRPSDRYNFRTWRASLTHVASDDELQALHRKWLTSD